MHARAQAIAVGGGGRGRGAHYWSELTTRILELSFGSLVVLLESFELPPNV